MQRKAPLLIIFAGLFVCLASLPALLRPETAYASTPYNASDVLGQFDINNNPTFDENDYCISTDISANCPNPGGMARATGVALDSLHHRLFVYDSDNSRVVVYNLDSHNNIVSHTPDNVLGQADFASLDTTLDGSHLGATPSAGLAYDAVNDRLFVYDEYNNCRVLVFDTATITNGEAAVNVLGQTGFDQNVCDTTPSNLGPHHSQDGGLAFDPSTGYLYVSGGGDGHRVLVFNVNPGTISDGEDAIFELGQTDFFTNNNAGFAPNSIFRAQGLAIDSDHHRLFVADDGFDLVKVFDTSALANNMDASYVLGCFDIDCNTLPNDNSAQFGGLEGLTYDPVQQLLFTSEFSDRILVFDTSTLTNGESASGLIGKSNFDDFTDNNPPSQSVINTSDNTNMAYDSVNRHLYLADNANSRVLVFNFVRITTTSLATATTGDSYDETIHTASGQGTTTFSHTAGSLPPGIGLNQSTGHLVGTPTTAGTYDFTIRANDANGVAGTFHDSHSYSITVAAGSSSGSNAVTTSELTLPIASAETPAPSTIVLNSFDDFLGAGGHALDLRAGDVIDFCINGSSDCPADSQHTVTVKSIDLNAGSVVITIASTPTDYTLYLNQAQKIDVDSDGQPDIQATLNSLTAKSANISFVSLATTQSSTTNSPATRSAAASTSHSSKSWLWWGLGGLAILAVTTWLARRR